MNATADLFAEIAPPAPVAVPDAPEILPLEPAWHPLTEIEWARVLGDRPFRVVITPEQEAWAGRRAARCSRCAHAGDTAGGEPWPWRAWCLVHRVQVSNTFPKLCREYLAG